MPNAESYDAIHVGALAAAVSIVFFRNFYTQGAILLYGDAVAHIHIARRVFDSITPGPLRLGTVWLPLPHILMIPFLVSDWMWRTGVGGSIVSMIAYVAGTVGVFRLVRSRTSAAGWFAAAIYALNPNLIYLQCTAMTEPLYLALFVWAVVFLDETLRPNELSQQSVLPVATAAKGGAPSDISRRARLLERAAILIAATMLTRYDGWWLAACTLAAAFCVTVSMLLKHSTAVREFFSGIQYRLIRKALRSAILLLAAIPTLWLAYNQREYGNPLEFATGPYSARAIEQRTACLRHPGDHSPRVAAIYFLKSVKLNLGDGRWEWPLFAAALIGLLISFVAARRFAVWWLFWLPLPFYVLSIACGGVPLFLPVWWPFSYDNTRYGVEMLPAVAVFAALTVDTLRRASDRFAWRTAVVALAIAVLAGSYISEWRATPITVREAVANSRTRIPFERTLADALRRLPRSASLLMYTAAHPGALQTADIHLRRVVNESNHPQWEQALHDPALVNYVVASDDDPVAQSAAGHRDTLIPLEIIQSSGQPRTTIYKTQRATRP